MSSGSGVCECWRLEPDGTHGSRACLYYGKHWREVAELLADVEIGGQSNG